jgi:uncharacterized protein YbaP (TraB family)
MLNMSSKGLLRGLFSGLLCASLLPAISVSAAQAAESKDIGLLWKLEAPTGKVSHLFGTMHSDDPRINDFSPALKQALKDSEAFMMEVLPASDPGIYLMENGENLHELMTEKEIEKVLELAEVHSMHRDAALTMKPWLLAMIFDLPKPQSPFTQDVMLYSMAQSQGMDVLGLEDTKEHFESLDSFSREEQLTMLRAVLKRTQKEKEKDFEALLKAYLTGDTAKIGLLDDDITGGMLPKALWQKMRVKLLDERNGRMAERIVSEANQNPVFVAVGASHLAGNGGLIGRLRAAGYKVSKVE